ncbi:MAG: hypothetical protein DHS20C10_02720 [marine bacterium B5-7]|nr:MAG: hypothetical protein DHS20C10_02720 [marine bacterium B5-7]
MVKVGSLHDFRRFIQLLAANVAQTLDYSHYARDIGVSVNTIKSWLSILEISYIVFTLPAYSSNLRKRIVKSPKVYFYDTGLVTHLTGIENMKQFESNIMGGTLFENYVISEIVKNNYHHQLNQQFYFLRTHDGMEIDLIIEHKQQRTLIEIKRSATFNPSMVRHLKTFREASDHCILLYNGETLPEGETRITNYRDYLTE